MNIEETRAIVAIAAVFCPGQTFTPDAPDVWHLALAGFSFTDVRDALVKLGGQRAWIAPSDVRQAVLAIRARRLAEVGEPATVPGLPTPHWRAEYLGLRRLIANGDMTREGHAEYLAAGRPVTVAPPMLGAAGSEPAHSRAPGAPGAP